jgi:SAM-dependent methyltransferase
MSRPEEHFARALQGEPCEVHGLGPRGAPLPVDAWLREPDADDRAILGHCTGATLDVGCGPGRMTAALCDNGQVALGIDVVPEAVAETIRRGGAALCRDVYDQLPGEGRWQCALLADGNIGIGGDPVGLLRRLRRLLGPAGRVVVEVAAPGVQSFALKLRLDCGGSRSRPFPWAFVSADDAEAVATDAGLMLRSLHTHGSRWCAVMECP